MMKTFLLILLFTLPLIAAPSTATKADISSATRDDTTVCTASGNACSPGGSYYDACEGVGLTTYDTCRAAGGSKEQCDASAKESQNNCLRDFGCPIIH